MKTPPARTIAYGGHPDQVANLHLPTDEGPWPAVVLIHGGFWKWGWDRTLMTLLAHDLADRGYAAWNVDYRRVGQEGGGWPGTFEDVAAAIDALADLPQVEIGRVATVGHSAGGQLALWLAARPRLPVGAPGGAPRVVPRAAVSQAGVLDLVEAAAGGLGDGACAAFLGGTPADVPERYAVASPTALLPLSVPQLLVHGHDDPHVPFGQSRAHADAARLAGDAVDLFEDPTADHFDVIEPSHPSWIATCAWLERALG